MCGDEVFEVLSLSAGECVLPLPWAGLLLMSFSGSKENGNVLNYLRLEQYLHVIEAEGKNQKRVDKLRVKLDVRM